MHLCRYSRRVHDSLLYLKELAESAQSSFSSTDHTNLDATSGAANIAMGDMRRGGVLGQHFSGGMLPVRRESSTYEQYDRGGRDDTMIYGNNSSVNSFKHPTDTTMEEGSRVVISQGGVSDSEGDQPLPFCREFSSSSDRLTSGDVIWSYCPNSNAPMAGPREAEKTFSFPSDRGGLGIGYRSTTFSSHISTIQNDRNPDFVRFTSTSSPQGMAGIEPPSQDRQSTAELYNDVYHLLNAEWVRR